MNQPFYRLHKGKSPLVAAAIHHGHAVRPEVAQLLAISEADRLREEDPFTGQWTTIADTQIIGLRSRFEVDLNRPRERAVYLTPADAWGLQIWQTTPPAPVIARSLAKYDAFYAGMHRLLAQLVQQHGRIVIFDLHTYNYRREGADGPPADPLQNPEVNVGTGTMDRQQWAPVVERFMADLRAFNFMDRHLDVRENIKFTGGYFSRWVHQTFPGVACVLAIEFKKFFMDEWSGQPDQTQLKTIRLALESTVTGVLETLKTLQ